MPQAQPVQRSRGRVRPEAWQKLPNVFFVDAFRESLRGPRPADLTVPSKATPEPAVSTTPAATPSGGEGWSQVVPASVVEDEIKRLHMQLDALLRSERSFLSGDYLQVQRGLAQAAVWFAIVSQFDQPIRWQEGAGSVAALLSQGAQRCGSATGDAYRAAVQCQTILGDLIRGSPPPSQPAPTPLTDWSQITARDPLMLRLQVAAEERLRPWSGDTQALGRYRPSIEHEAHVVSAFAQVLQQPGLEDAADQDYIHLSRQLRRAALQVTEGTRAQDPARVQSAVSNLRQACSACHDVYRE
jgi:hypothetical protein